MPRPKNTRFVVAYYIRNNGDGSASIELHNTIRDASKAASKASERFDNDTGTVELEFDSKGKLISRNDDFDEDDDYEWL